MRMIFALAASALFATPALAGTLTVQNQSATVVSQNDARGAFEGFPAAVEPSGSTTKTVNFPPSLPQQYVLGQVTYKDVNGKGCVFSLAAYPQSGTQFIVIPIANPVNGGVCSTARGANQNDFIYIVK